MAKFMNTTSRRNAITASSGWIGRLWALLRRRRPRDVSLLSDAQLRDIGLSNERRSELRKIEGLRWP